MKKLLLILVFFIPFISVYSQEIEEQLLPTSNIGLRNVPILELPAIDLETIRVEDSINDLDKSIPWRYGILRPIIVNLENDCQWTTLENGDRLWRVGIKSPEAINISINFDDFHLPDGGMMQLYNEDRSDVSKIFTSLENRGLKKLGSWYIHGETIFAEYYQPSGTNQPVELNIGSIIHGYRLGRVNDILGNSNAGRGINDSGACNYDVNCSIGQDFDSKKDFVKKAVALLNLGNGYLCSAALINNTAQDKKPLLLTANHCLDNSDPTYWSVRFNWTSPNPVCAEEEQSADIQSNFTMSGTQYRASNSASDFALVELFNEIPASWDVAFAGWDRSDITPDFQVGIHHPNGDIMKICRDNDPASKEDANGTQVWLINGVSAGNGNGWDIGTTESGSSGSPLFNQDGRIIGQLYAGQSFCNGTENNNDYDVYGRIAVSWDAGTTPETRLMDWLDPSGSGTTIIDGLSNALNTPDFELSGQLEVYPNPAAQYVYILNTRYPNLSYSMYNIIGQEINQGNISASENRIDVSQFNEGVYFLKIIDADSNDDITKKIIINR